MPKFQLQKDCGTHYHHGIKTAPGNVVEDDEDLEEIYPNKFRKVDDSVPVTPTHVRAAPPKSEHTDPITDPMRPTRARRQAEADEAEAKGAEASEEASKSGGKGAGAKVKGKKSKEGKETPVEPPGEEVTKDFPMASEIDLKVFKEPGVNAYYVCDNQEPWDQVHPTPLKKSQVNPFLKDYAAKE